MSLFTSQSTSNYHARKYGVRAAMPGFIAKKLCPNLVIVPTNFDKYRAVSSEVRVMEKHTNQRSRYCRRHCTILLSNRHDLVSVRSVRFFQIMTPTSCQWAWMKLTWISQNIWKRGRAGQSPYVRVIIVPAAPRQVGALLIKECNGYFF